MLGSTQRFLIRHTVIICVIVGLVLVFGTVNYVYTDQISAVVTTKEAQIKAATAAIAKLKNDTKTSAKTSTPVPTPPAVAPANPSTPAVASSSSCNDTTTHSNPMQIDVLVNKKHCLVPLSFVPGDLVTIDGATLSQKAAPSFDAMYQQAAADGQAFGVSSSYRSYTTQVSTYNHWVSISGQAGADTYSARAGYSEHQTGLAVDVEANGDALSDFVKTTQYAWLQAHAAEYGFIQRYPEGYESITGYETEEWHYRYVGTVVAQDMKAQGIATLEQYLGISGGDYN